MEDLVPLGGLAVAALTVGLNCYSIRSRQHEGRDARVFEKRVDSYGEVINQVVVLRDFARAPSEYGPKGKYTEPPILDQKHLLDLQAKVEMFGSPILINQFDGLPGRVNQLRVSLLDDNNSQGPPRGSEAKEAREFRKKTTTELETQCDRVLSQARADLGVGTRKPLATG